MRALILLCLIAGAFATPAGTAECNAHPAKCPKTPLPHSTSRLATKTRPANDYVIISTPLLRLGVYGPGSLDAYPTDFPSANTDPANGNPVGLRYLGGVENDATAPGCLCEGFGVSAVFDDGHTESAVADQSTGFAAISYGTPTAVGTTGADATAVALTAPHTLGVKHEFRLSSVTNNAFQVNITLTNQHPTASITRLRYERQMDWDIYPTTFAECVDIDIGTAQDLPCAHDNGFVDGNPDTNFPDPSGAYINLGSCGGSFPRQLFNSGPADHGAAFLIQFHDINSTHPLGPGESKSFLMFYGAAGNKAAAQAVLGLLNVEAYSLGYPSAATDGGARTCDPSINFGAPNTYLWAFAGIGGEVVNPGGCSGTDCAVTTACPTASSASASTTTSNCASIGFAASAC